MNFKKQITKTIRETCTHWIVIDKAELSRVKKELNNEFKQMVEAEIRNQKEKHNQENDIDREFNEIKARLDNLNQLLKNF